MIHLFRRAHRIHIQLVSRGAMYYAVFMIVVLTIIAHAAQQQHYSAAASQASSERQRIELRQLQDDRDTLQLALEFGFDPMIVKVAKTSARREYFRDACATCLTWRFVRTYRELAYLMLSIVQIESGGNHRIIGDGGRAHGLTQMWLATARVYEPVSWRDLLTIEGNISVAMKHLVDLLRRFDGNPYAAVTAWNRGEGAVRRDLSAGSDPGNGYADRVFAAASAHNAVPGRIQ